MLGGFSMKLVLRIFNLIIIAVSLATIILIFTQPAFTFNSNIGIDIAKLAKMVPETEYSKDLKLNELVGTDTIHLGIKFELTVGDLHKAMSKDKDTIDDLIISKNVDNIVDTMHEPINLITEYTIRTVVKNLIKTVIKSNIENAIPEGSGSTSDDIMNEVGLDEEYFTKFAEALYDVTNSGATVNEATNVLNSQIDDALTRADESGEIDVTAFADDEKESVKNTLVNTLTTLKLVNSDNTIKKVSDIPYVYFAEYLKNELSSRITDTTELNQKSDEANADYADRLTNLFVITMMPDAFYTIVSYVSLGLFIGLFVFTGIWLLLVVITLLRTLSRRKPWTFFGPLFWIAGILEIILGLGITIAGKFVLPKYAVNFDFIPINYLVIVPRTYALVLSIVFLAMVVFMIPYTVVKVSVKYSYKKEGKHNEEE